MSTPPSHSSPQQVPETPPRYTVTNPLVRSQSGFPSEAHSRSSNVRTSKRIPASPFVRADFHPNQPSLSGSMSSHDLTTLTSAPSSSQASSSTTGPIPGPMLTSSASASNLSSLPSLGVGASALGIMRSQSKLNVLAKDWSQHVPQVTAPNLYVQRRSGSILSIGMVLKSDRIPFAEEPSLMFHVSGAPNFRQVQPLPIYAVGQPSVPGIRALLNLMQCRGPQTRRCVHWINLREEPIVYLNNRPYVLREFEYPFRNLLDFNGIVGERINEIEELIKHDILDEGDHHDSNALVHEEVQMCEVRPVWESISPATIQTSRQVYDYLRHSEGYHVKFHRVPVTAESVFDPEEFDCITRIYAQASCDGTIPAFVFNCQMGRGRSSIGQIIVYLLQQHCHGRQNVVNVERPTPEHLASESLGVYLRGEYDIIMKLCRLMRFGLHTKQVVDEAIDACGQVHHLREVILDAFLKCEHAREQDEQKMLATYCIVHLRRYFLLICFQSYLSQLPQEFVRHPHFTATGHNKHATKQKKAGASLHVPDASLFSTSPPSSSSASSSSASALLSASPSAFPPASTPEFLAQPFKTFKQWLAERPELMRLSEVVTTDALQKLVLTQGSPEEQKEALSESEELVYNRKGGVLGKRTILKTEFFPATSALEKTLANQGIPNFRHLETIPLAALAQPSVSGIKRVLEFFGARRGSERKAERKGNNGSGNGEAEKKIVWINLRDEPVVYLGEQATLLRDYCHPFHVLPEFETGMTPERSEEVESRLRRDIIAEAAELDGQVLVHQEDNMQLDECWKQVSHDEVKTTRQVYDEFVHSGYRLKYYRVPLNVDSAPALSSLDRLFKLLNKYMKQDVTVVFNCQMGGRRSSMGLIVACLLLLHADSNEYVSHLHDAKEQRGTRVPPSPGLQAMKTPRTSASTPSFVASLSPIPDLDLGGGGGMPSLDLSSSASSSENASASSSASLPSTSTSTSIFSSSSLPARAPDASSPSPSPSLPHSSSCDADLTIPTVLGSTSHVHEPSMLRTSSASAPSASSSYSGPFFNLHVTQEPESKDGNEEAESEADPFSPQGWSIEGTKPMKRSRSVQQMAEELQVEHVEEVQRSRHKFGRGEFKGILNLVRVLKQGRTVKDELDAVIDTCGTVFNIRDAIYEARQQADNDRSGHSDSSRSRQALRYLEAYGILLCFNAFLRERRESQRRRQASGESLEGWSFPPFSVWMKNRPELAFTMENFHRYPEESLKLDTFLLDDQYASVYEKRNGNVLVKGMIVKNDFFVGCKNKNVEQFVEGAVNFRPVPLFPVAGTGIPTADGICNILSYFTHLPYPREGDLYQFQPSSSLPSAKSMCWVNLREEPVVYVNMRPFVLRDHGDPYHNIETTGITRKRVEAMERQLKKDLLAEAQCFNGNVLLHDETSDGTLCALWVPIPREECVLTSQEMFQLCMQKFAFSPAQKLPTLYCRIPITDEQAPSPEGVDELVGYLEDGVHEQHRVHVFNCQMGRGRTTTGVIVACLWAFHRRKQLLPSEASVAWDSDSFEPDFFSLLASYGVTVQPRSSSPSSSLSLEHKDKDKDKASSPTSVSVSTSAASSSPALPASSSLFSASSSSSSTSSPLPTHRRHTSSASHLSVSSEEAEREREREKEEKIRALKSGWYQVIRKLVRLLGTNGKDVKKQVDRVIDHTGIMQNLREAVYQMQELALGALERKRDFFVRRGVNYLIRYFYLITINAYLHEQVSSNFTQHFSQWLKERPEIPKILEHVAFPEI